MARFDRKILLPYLRDLYSVELLTLKRQQEYQELNNRLRRYEEELQDQREPEPEIPASGFGLVILSMVTVTLCVAAAASCALIKYDELFLPVPVLTLVTAAVCIVWLLKRMRRYQQASTRYAAYQKQLQQYQRGKQARELLREQIEESRKQILEFADQSNILASIRHSLYSANVIPNPFRTVYAVQYLFNYFQSSKADDVDMVLQTFAVQELRREHRTISRKEADRILHQRMLLANQIMGDSMQRQYVENQMMEIANRDENAEFRNQYLKMISLNQDVSNFFFQQTFE